jgi:hypothetical protein
MAQFPYLARDERTPSVVRCEEAAPPTPSLAHFARSHGHPRPRARLPGQELADGALHALELAACGAMPAVVLQREDRGVRRAREVQGGAR